MNRPYGASFGADPRHAFADGAEHLIGHGADFAGDFERGDGFAARGADKDDLIAHGDAGDIGDVEQGQVHADVPDNRGGAAADERPPSVRKRAAEAVGVADRHRSDARAPSPSRVRGTGSSARLARWSSKPPKPQRRIVPHTAATCPWGSERVISKAWGRGGSVALFPLNTCRRASTFSGG